MTRIVSLIVFISLCGTVLPAGAEDDPLRGVIGIRVLAYPTKDSEAAGLTADTVQTEVELMLRQYGIRVLSQEEYRKEGAALTVLVRAFYEKTVSGVRQGYFSMVILEVEELAFLARDMRKPTFPTPHLMRTWETHRARTGPPESLKAGTLESLQEVVKEFANKYLAVNPREAR